MKPGQSIREGAGGVKQIPAVWDLVIADMRQRDAVGLKTYGKRLTAGNGRDALQDAYEESLDLAVYLRQAIYERDHPIIRATNQGGKAGGEA